MTYKFFVTAKCFYAMVTTKNSVTYYVGNTYSNIQKDITEEYFMRALEYFINVHDGYIMIVE